MITIVLFSYILQSKFEVFSIFKKIMSYVET